MKNVVNKYIFLIFAILFIFFQNYCLPQVDQRNTSIISIKKNEYPKSKEVKIIDDYFDIDIADPYRWLENMNSKETKEWVKIEDNFTRRYLEGKDKVLIKNEITKLMIKESYQTPAKGGDKIFYIRSSKKDGRNLYYKTLDNKTPVLVYKIKRGALPIFGYEPSPNGKYIAVAERKMPSQWMQWRVIDVGTKKFLPDVTEGIYFGMQKLVWSQNSKGFYYERFNRKGKGVKVQPVNGYISFHLLRDTLENDKVIYKPENKKNASFEIKLAKGLNSLVITERENSKINSRVLLINLANENVTDVLKRIDASFDFLGNVKNIFYLRTDYKAPNGRIISVDVSNPGEYAWQTIVPEKENILMGYNSGGGQAIPILADKKLILPYQKNVLTHLEVYGLNGKYLYEGKLPAGGMLFEGGGRNPICGSENDNNVFYKFIGITDPSAVFNLDLNSGKSTIFLRATLPFNPDKYVTEQKFYHSKDGTRVSIFITHNKNMKLDSKNPVLLYAYGAGGFSMTPFYQARFLAWLEMGGIVAIPNVRGGGEYGKTWYNDGILLKKQNGIDDYIASAEWLITNNYTGNSLIAATAVSAGSILPLASMIQKPYLFGAVIPGYPFSDLLRSEQTGGQWMVDEIGSVKKENEFNAILKYSPYENLRKGTCYPPTMILASDKDDNAWPLHAYKFIAKLQNYQGCSNPALLYLAWGSAHSSYGRTTDDVIQTWTDQLFFISKVLKLYIENLSS